MVSIGRRLLGLMVVLCLSPAVSAQEDSRLHIRVNQMGYLPADPKSAMVLTNATVTEFEIVNTLTGEAAAGSEAVTERGAYGQFAHLYELTFDHFNQTGTYQIKVESERSHPFVIGDDAYSGLIEKTLTFFRVQRSGNTDPLLHQPSHLNDGIASGGVNDGQVVDATGGWYDAGDYIKFSINESFAASLMLLAYERRPAAFGDSTQNHVPDVLDEARIGLDWLLKMWDGEHQILYYQVGDTLDHASGWRMPENDDQNLPPRKVYACEAGKGVNVAGSAAAALARAAFVWNNRDASYYDAALAQTYLEAAEAIYAYGKANPKIQNDPDGFYAQNTWQDKMALAAVLLYRATSRSAYLEEARQYATAPGHSDTLAWVNVHALADYELARADKSYLPVAQANLINLLVAFPAAAKVTPFHAGVTRFYWGSLESMAGLAVTAMLYQELTGDTRYYPAVVAQRNFVFGINPWGVSFVNGAGKVYPHNPHHQVANITGEELVGFWDEGPVPLSDFEEQGIRLSEPDIYADFQTDEAVYHDLTEDYMTNEPTIGMNAVGLLFAVWFVPVATG